MPEACTGLGSICPTDAKVPNGTGCDDNDTCTTTDTCQSGTCTGDDPLDCNDATPCTQDGCDAMAGCVNQLAPASGCLAGGKSSLLLKIMATSPTAARSTRAKRAPMRSKTRGKQ